MDLNRFNEKSLALTSLSDRTSERLKPILGVYVVGGAAVGLASKWVAKAKAEFTYTVAIPGNDDLYVDLHTWLMQNLPSRRRRALTVRGGEKSHSLVSDVKPSLKFYYDGSRSQTIKLDGHSVHVYIERSERGGSMREKSPWSLDEERIILTVRGTEGRDAILSMLEKIMEVRFNKKDPRFYRSHAYGDWVSVDSMPLRQLSTVELREGQKETIVADLQDFLDSEAIYNKLGMPWHRGYLFHGPPGTGKGHPMDTPVLCPGGWRQIGDLVPGDEIIGSDGQATTVVEVYDRGLLPVYKVSFTDKSFVICDDEHLWPVDSRSGKKRGKETHVMSVKELRSRSLKFGTNSTNYSVPLVAVVEHPEVELPIPPYILGTLIANGHLKKTPIVSTNDMSVVEEIQAELPSWMILKEVTSRTSTCRNWNLRGERQGNRHIHNPVNDALRDLNLFEVLSHDKFVPSIYLYAPSAIRLRVLQGLMDCDGSQSGQHTRYSTTSLRLAGNVVELVQSFGGTASVIFDKREPINYTVHIKMPSTIVPFTTPHKLQRFQSAQVRAMSPYRGIAAITPIGEAEVRCIRVKAADNLYVTKDYLVTHNSSLAKALACYFGLDLYYCSLASIQNDNHLSNLVNNVSPSSVLLFEDIDIAHSSRKRDDGEPGVTMSGFLNVLDGVLTPHGLITMMTTNDLSVIDPAVLRPGRVDRREEIGFVDDEQLRRLLGIVIDHPIVVPPVGRKEISPAQIVEIMKRTLGDEEGLVLAMKELLE